MSFEQGLVRKDLLLDWNSGIIQDSPVNFRVISKTRDLFHYINIEKNECSCESKLYRGLYKKDPAYECEHLRRVKEALGRGGGYLK